MQTILHYCNLFQLVLVNELFLATPRTEESTNSQPTNAYPARKDWAGLIGVFDFATSYPILFYWTCPEEAANADSS